MHPAAKEGRFDVVKLFVAWGADSIIGTEKVSLQPDKLKRRSSGKKGMRT